MVVWSRGNTSDWFASQPEKGPSSRHHTAKPSLPNTGPAQGAVRSSLHASVRDSPSAPSTDAESATGSLPSGEERPSRGIELAPVPDGGLGLMAPKGDGADTLRLLARYAKRNPGQRNVTLFMGRDGGKRGTRQAQAGRLTMPWPGEMVRFAISPFPTRQTRTTRPAR
ncbi:hypothetical protein VTK73DRAFT_4036 [Phialemonium thermophilum]|uniref:Uncharacterized protein n=1 Tax=Phialemonium thermophilum TaxID=223376 RepID=A0ABR3VDX6_9PEZI